VPGVQRLAGDAPLDGEVDGRELERADVARASAGAEAVILPAIHVTVHAQIFVRSPACRAMIDDEIADGVSTQRVVAVADVHIRAAEAQIADDDVVRLDFDGVPRDADAVAGGGGAADRDVRRADA